MVIAQYEKKIASGSSDREYERAMQLSGGNPYVQHDRDRVQQWKDALGRISPK